MLSEDLYNLLIQSVQWLMGGVRFGHLWCQPVEYKKGGKMKYLGRQQDLGKMWEGGHGIIRSGV